MRYYRIKQINDNQFIPQTKRWWENWEGIDRRNTDTWYGSHYQLQYCTVTTIEEANRIIKEYKVYWDKVKQYPKYHPFNMIRKLIRNLVKKLIFHIFIIEIKFLSSSPQDELVHPRQVRIRMEEERKD
jgi:hypothetical protein